MEEKDVSKNGFLLVSKYRGAIMGIAALWIYVFHAWVIMSPEPEKGSFSLIYFLADYNKRLGYAGVDIFFLLSGIGLTFAIKKESTLKFYYKRIRRVALPALTIGIIRGIVQDWGFMETLRIVSGFNFFTKTAYDFVWFVPAIIICYFFFPFYWKLFEKISNKFLFTAGAVIVWLAVALLLRNVIRRDLCGFINRIPIFLIGILCGYLTQERKNAVFKVRTYLLLSASLISGLVFWYLVVFKGLDYYVTSGHCFLPTLLIAIGLTFLTAKLLDVIDRRLSRFGKVLSAILVFMGSISLELYCVQWWFADMVPILLEAGWPKYLVNISMFLMTTAAAWVMSMLIKFFWELVEKPFSSKSAAED